MNPTILFSVLMVFCHISLAKKEVSSIILFPSQSDNTCQSPGLQCKDCETLQLCSSNLQSLFETKCGDQSKTRPYCNSETNSCVKTKPAVCEIQQPSFVCPGVGTYPDLENCNNYYVCDENKIPENFPCSEGYIYDHSIKGCSPGTFCRSYSTKIGQCKGKVNKLIPYTPSKELYILCLSGRPSLLFQCSVKGDSFNEEEVTCKFECTKNGFFPYYPDSNKYYLCLQNGKKFALTLLECPDGTEFVNHGNGQGICSTKTTPSTTTELIQTTQVEEEINNIDEGSGDAQIDNENNNLDNVVPSVDITYEELLLFGKINDLNESNSNDSADNSESIEDKK